MRSLLTPTHETAGAAGIELRGLVRSFASPAGRVRAVRGVDLGIEAGETVALLGPNGAGKSTLIDLLLGLLEPDAGSVSLFGRPPAQAIAEGAVGAMLQTGGLLRGLRAVDPALAAEAIAEGTSPLTPRAAEVLSAAARHGTVAEIARALHLSEGTVRSYLSASMRKLRARNRREAVDLATEKGWL